MDSEDLVARLEQKAAHHAREAERYKTAAEVLRMELRGTRTARSPRSTSSGPSTSEMVEAALNESGEPLHPNELVEKMRGLGWNAEVTNPVNTVRTAAHRLAEQGRLEKLPGGRYSRLGANGPSEAAISALVAHPSDETTAEFGAARQAG